MSRFGYDESKLRPGQREAAHELVMYEFSPKKGTDEFPGRKTKQQIADDVGVSRKTLHEWDTKDTNFIAYKNKVASDMLNSMTPLVYAELMANVRRGSMRAIETFMKRIGDLDSRSEVTLNDNTAGAMTLEERKADLERRLAEAKALEQGE